MGLFTRLTKQYQSWTAIQRGQWKVTTDIYLCSFTPQIPRWPYHWLPHVSSYSTLLHTKLAGIVPSITTPFVHFSSLLVSLQPKLHPGSISCLEILVRTLAISPGPLTTLWKKTKWATWSSSHHWLPFLLLCTRITETVASSRFWSFAVAISWVS